MKKKEQLKKTSLKRFWTLDRENRHCFSNPKLRTLDGQFLISIRQGLKSL